MSYRTGETDYMDRKIALPIALAIMVVLGLVAVLILLSFTA